MATVKFVLPRGDAASARHHMIEHLDANLGPGIEA
jgi:hypothetical protein